MSPPAQVKGFTVQHTGLARELRSTVGVAAAFDPGT